MPKQSTRRFATIIRSKPSRKTIKSTLGLLSLSLLLSGCSGKPPAVRPIKIDAGAAAKLAMEEFDTDGDGEISASEMDQCASIKKSVGYIDKDNNGTVSESELKERLLQWKEPQMGIRSLKVVVSMNGKPLSDADVEFLPEPFMGDIAKPAYGFTNEEGVANMTHDAKDMPKGAENARGVTNGFFKIRITHPDKEIPAKFNDESILGQEVAMDTINSVMNIEL